MHVRVAAAFGIGVLVVGWFLVRAAVKHDPNEPIGLDQSLRALADQSLGVVLIWIAVAGLAAYGLLCLATSAWLDPNPDT